MRGRIVGVLTLLLLAPISAELLAAYLGDLGGVGGLIFLVLFLAPLYGGAGLLIREISVRTGRGWPGRLLLAAAFGVAMTTVIDGSLFTPEMDDIDDWSSIVEAASFGSIGWSAVVAWVGGHVVMSIGAPIAVAEALARKPEPWLGRIGLFVAAVGFLCIAAFLHQDHWAGGAVNTSTVKYAVSMTVIGVLAGLAFSPLGRPLPANDHRAPRPWVCLVFGLVAMAGFDIVPMSWPGVATAVGVIAIATTVISWWARSPRWSMRHVAALAFGGLLARTLMGFLAPLPQETTYGEKISQNVTYLVLVLLLCWALERRTRQNQVRAEHTIV